MDVTQTAEAAAAAAADPGSTMIAVKSLVLSLMRWTHYVAGVLWIGHLWFFNFVNLNAQPEIPADLKKQVNPPILVRALFLFRWGAMFTFITGLYLMDVLYNHGGLLLQAGSNIKAAYMSLGILAGTVMWFNVWFIIWPAQKKILGGMQGGPAADPKLAPRAMKASKINTYLSVPMLLGMMGGAHGEYQLFGGSMSGLLIGVGLGLGVVYIAYTLAPKISSKLFTPPA